MDMDKLIKRIELELETKEDRELIVEILKDLARQRDSDYPAAVCIMPQALQVM